MYYYRPTLTPCFYLESHMAWRYLFGGLFLVERRQRLLELLVVMDFKVVCFSFLCLFFRTSFLEKENEF